ncbi:MAG: [FeFe] hydrogenase H-cluster maturation GTPase HydF [Eubacterium sp.]|nr:[FeFe] hydrogenase H-cluster maturation GTPase HydF [Eubacterium sp.]
MSLNATPSGERIHIGFFGRRNAGKSSLVNAVTGQNLSIVSSHKGTTTDPVQKAMELLPLGPVMIVDTPGFDDEGDLGRLRIQKAKDILGKVDMAVLVMDVLEPIIESEKQLIEMFMDRDIPFLIVFSKWDLLGDVVDEGVMLTGKTREMSRLGLEVSEEQVIFATVHKQENITLVKERIIKLMKNFAEEKFIVKDLIPDGDTVVLVIPIDSGAPKGRIILPQQQVLRELLDAGKMVVAVRESELEEALKRLENKVSLVITDSQAFEVVDQIVPEEIPLTSFSILMARYKGFFEVAIDGIETLDSLKDGDRILISEGCTHHRQCDDIGTVKIPKWLTAYTGKKLEFENSVGRDFPQDVSGYALVIHCGGCMLNEREVLRRMSRAVNQGIPFTNYGMTIAKMKGILERSIEIIKK